MSWASEQAIDNHNRQMESDESYAENFHRQMDEEEVFHFHFEQEKDNEIFVDWFSDKIIDHAGQTVELAGKINDFDTDLTDEDLPF